MEMIEFVLLSNSGVRASSKIVTCPKANAEMVSINSLSLIIKNRLHKIVSMNDIFSDVLELEVICSNNYMEKEEEYITTYTQTWAVREKICGYSYTCRGFEVRLYFDDSKCKNTFKLKGNVAKLIEKLNSDSKSDKFSII